MQIGMSSVATLHYTLRDDAGEVLDASAADEPLVYLHGHGNIVIGLERALEGKRAGDSLQVSVDAEDAYGMRDEGLVQDVPRDAFPRGIDITTGMQFHAESNRGPRSVIVTAVTAETVRVDGNHPLAGQRLHFDVTVAAVRAATHEEVTHGHVHGDGGHHH